MEHHLDHKIVLGKEPEHKSLYGWFLKEVGDNVSKYASDQIPWVWTQYFKLSEIRLNSITKAENEHDSEGTKITDEEYIIAKLRPDEKDGCAHRNTTYSMFGTNRRVTNFDLQIRKTADKEKQGCSAWGSVSYAFENDFVTDTQPDTVTFYLMVSEEIFDRYAQRICEKSVTSALFTVSVVAGFYSEWSPAVSTSNIKILTSDKKDHPVEIPEGCEIVPPRLGSVGKAALYLYSAQEFNLPSVEDFDDNSENDM